MNVELGISTFGETTPLEKTGKAISHDAEDDSRIVEGTITMREADENGLLPCTKHYAMDWVGTVKFGVEITADELAKWQKTNKDKKPEIIGRYLVVGECSGMNEETREYMTEHQEKLNDSEIDYYVEHYKPLDKAGAYGIQEWIGHIGVSHIKGSYFNVMGLPVQRIYEELRKMEELKK